MAQISSPSTTPVDEQDGKGKIKGVNGGWRNFFNSVYTICNALTMSGTTANRPASGLWVGRTYFDTTIGKPIWFKSPGWVDATGAPV